ncbi:MAG: hypothetical protein QF486_03415 [Candidatus Woesearchaeota archaeon]|jgi:DNA-directed RNA polymerase subunit F|nr:hypothetical protein [Candidatus Woesearchaeota archaeon]MDP7182043.1 hypothetical protein [Candidatus Woesearchaeota archaeon]MDP7198645.1 hypothetical protein [Candidatus Woesearchaeota archaeon]MDP7467619.1 hypothetical protein [Candidatus Woesearchaeota archaeon]MDP7647163.1 hypothetical protein [Candidatus Woesearchaeota archaeon]|tara:strand:- start:13 stop:357 length:345 start_codon:yes stop_codon:yes gene_type:complete
MKDQIISENPVSLPFVREALEKVQKNGELNFRAQKTLEHAETCLLSVKEANTLIESLEKIGIPRWKDVFAHKIIDSCPLTPEQVKVVLSCYNVTFSKEHTQKIAEAVVAVKPKT